MQESVNSCTYRIHPNHSRCRLQTTHGTISQLGHQWTWADTGITHSTADNPPHMQALHTPLHMQTANNPPHIQASHTPLHMQTADNPCHMQLAINSRHMQAANKQPEADSNDSLSGSQQPQEASRASAGTSPSFSLGQRMKKCQAFWRPLPLAACPLTLPAPSGAAYPLPPPAEQAAALPQQTAACCLPQQAKQARSATDTDLHRPVMQI